MLIELLICFYLPDKIEAVGSIFVSLARLSELYE